jgi:phosphatidate cytidylyltransferase
MLRQRIITAAIGLPVILAITWLGNPWFTIMVAIIAVLGSIEFYRMVISPKIGSLTCFAIFITVLLSVSPYYPSFLTKPIILTLAIIVSLAWLIFLPKKDSTFSKWAWLIGGIIYIGWMLSYWAELRNLTNGLELTFWSIFIVMASDTCAFFAGRAWGKHYMAPSISPQKTWEGAVGGLLGSIIVSIVLGIVFSIPFNYWQLVLLGFLVGVLAQIGDLVESLLKRNNGVKDSGNLIPGHGGILDRVDSFILVGAIVYYCAIAASI